MSPIPSPARQGHWQGRGNIGSLQERQGCTGRVGAKGRVRGQGHRIGCGNVCDARGGMSVDARGSVVVLSFST